MHGLMRTRGFEQDDAHVFCREDQAVEEMGRFIDLLHEVYAALGFSGYEVALATRLDQRAGSDAQWDWVPDAQLGCNFVISHQTRIRKMFLNTSARVTRLRLLGTSAAFYY